MDALSRYPGGYVYLIKVREFIRTDDPILKVGRSRNIMERLRSYSVGCVLLGCWFVHDDAAAERALVNSLCASPDMCKRLANIGNEWFLAHSSECERNMVLLCHRVVHDVISSQPLPLIDLRKVYGGTAPQRADDANTDAAGMDASEPDEEGGVCSSSMRRVPLDGHPQELQSTELRGLRDPYSVLYKFCRHIQLHAPGQVFSADRLTDQAKDWARRHGYDGPALMLSSASRVFSECGARRVQVVEDGALMVGFSIPGRREDGGGTAARSSNKLQRFLDMEDDERGFIIAYRPAAVTWVPDFKQAYQAVMRDSLGVIDENVLRRRGFSLSDGFEHVCLSCKGLARGAASGKCCPDYSNLRRTRKRVVFNMVIPRY